MMQHVGQFMTIHGSILPFTQQGLENHNDNMTKNFFRSSCLRGEQALQQLVEKQNRIEHFLLEQRDKRLLRLNAPTVVVMATIG